MEKVVKAVEKTISKEMPKGIILDGWTHGTEHFLAVFGCFETPDGPRYPLLFMAPIMDEPDDALGADGHVAAIARFLPFFGRSLTDVLFLVGDNCGVNKKMARLMGVLLVGCASHRLNLAVREHLAPHEEGLEQVQTLMRKLRTIKQAAKLRQKTSLQPVLRQDTRWSSTYAMLSRYFRLYEHLSPDDEDLEDFFPSRAVHRSLRKLFDELSDVESISKKLQSDGLSILDARDLLDGLLEVQPSFRSYIAPDAPIVHSPKFDSAVVKVLGGQVARLTAGEKATLLPFRRGPLAVAVEIDEEDPSFAERILKPRKVEAAPSTYTLLSSIPPTSNVVERLFSSARAVLRHERHRLSPMVLEMILFLKVNSSYWNVATVDACLQ